MGYWFIVHNLTSYQQHPDLIGHVKPDRSFRSIRENDRTVYYAKGKKLVGVFRVTQPGRILGEDKYWRPKDLVYEIKPVLCPMSPLDFQAGNFGVTVLSKTTTALSERQYKDILCWLLGLWEIPDETNHETVVTLFAKMHRDLGYPRIKIVRQDFPDCIAMDREAKDVRIEFEAKATDFNHDIDGCDKIVCWADDWGPTAPQGKLLSLKEWLLG